MKNPKSVSGSGFNFAKRLGAYSAVAAATAAATDSIDAAEVVWDIPDVEVGDSPGLLFNMVTGATSFAPGAQGNTTEGSMRLIGYYDAGSPGAYLYTPASSTLGACVGFGSDASLLAAGVQIDGNQDFVGNPAYPSIGNYVNLNNWTPEGTRGFVGIRFQLDGATHYGWADITHNDAANTAILHAFGYNDTPGAASVTPVPPVLTITEFDYDAGANAVTLTWRKTEAASYTARYSTDMTDWGAELDDSITADRDENPEDEDHITVTFPLVDGLENEPDLFFRIEEQ